MKLSLKDTHWRGMLTRPGETACGLFTSTKNIKIASFQALVTCKVCRGEAKVTDDENAGLTPEEKGTMA